MTGLNIDAARCDMAAPPSVKARLRLAAAFADLRGGAYAWRLWLKLAWIETLQRYRRSVLGPFWLTVSTAVMIVALGAVYSQIFRVNPDEFIPFLCAGLLLWGFISASITEAGSIFVGAESYIRQIRQPLTLYVWRFVAARVIVFAHNVIVYVAVMAYYAIWPGWTLFAAAGGLLLLIVNAYAAGITIAVFSTRFRDIPQLIGSLTQVIFFLTPVLWKPELLAGKQFIATLNPFFHLIEVVRAPLLGHWPSVTTVVVVLSITGVNMLIAVVLFARFRSRIAYWV